jgi:CelD/BcsL family acetyltransferase involved in cellulose biosynthesis
MLAFSQGDAMFSVEVLETVKDLVELMPDWQRLFEESSPRVPVRSPFWCLIWWKHYRRNTLMARDDLRVYVLRDDVGSLRAVAPMMRTARPGIGPVRSREMQFLGADAYVSQLRGICARTEDLDNSVRALSAAIAAENSCDWIQWRGVPEPVSSALSRFEDMPQLHDINCIVRLEGSYDSFTAALPRRTRKKLRKCYRDLETAGISFDFDVKSGSASLGSALDDFLRLHQYRADQENVTKHPNIFNSGTARDFLGDYCSHAAERDSLRVFQLKVGGDVVATRIGFQFNDEIYLYFSGFDPEWGKYSIMTLLIAEIFKWAFANGIRLVNLSSGIDRSKTRWNPAYVAWVGGYSPNAGAVSALKFRVIRYTRHRGGGATAPEAANDDVEGEEASANGA